MNSCILLTHVFIEDGQQEKIDQLKFSTAHYRKHNPDAYIILVGHGISPNVDNECDRLIWYNEINRDDIGVGHPHLTNVGLEHATEMGFTHVCKQRADGIHLKNNILEYCEQSLETDKKILTTQETSFQKKHMGDLFIYGEIEFLKKCYEISTWYPTSTGLISLANNFQNSCPENDWVSCLKNNCSFKDTFSLRWIDLRQNWQHLKYDLDNLMLNALKDFHKYIWSDGKYDWSKRGKLLRNEFPVETEKTWYA